MLVFLTDYIISTVATLAVLYMCTLFSSFYCDHEILNNMK